VLTYRDGGMNPAFAAKYPERNPMADQKVATAPSRQTESEVVFAPPAQTAAQPAKGPSVVAAATPVNDSRPAAASNPEPQKKGAFDRIGEWLGLNKKDNFQPQQASIGATATPAKTTAAPVPPAKPKPATQTTTAAAKPVAQPKPAPAQEKDSAPAAIGTLPGSPPILSTGGFSSFR